MEIKLEMLEVQADEVMEVSAASEKFSSIRFTRAGGYPGAAYGLGQPAGAGGYPGAAY